MNLYIFSGEILDYAGGRCFKKFLAVEREGEDVLADIFLRSSTNQKAFLNDFCS